MDEIGTVVPFYSGASYENLAREYGRQWPCTKDRPLGTRSLFADGLPARRLQVRARHPARSRLPAPEDYPLTLVFGHSLYYWHQNVLIQHSETLKREYRILLLDYPEGFVEMNPDDAKQLGIRDGEKIRLRGRRRLGGDRRAGHARGAQRHGLRALLRAPGAAADSRLDGERRPAHPRPRGKGGGMKARILDRADVLKIVDLLRQQGYEVFAPFAGRGRDTWFDTGHRREPRPDPDPSAEPVLPAQALRPAAHRAAAEGAAEQRRRSRSSRPTGSASAPSSASAPATWRASGTWTASTWGASSATSTTRSAARTCSW